MFKISMKNLTLTSLLVFLLSISFIVSGCGGTKNPPAQTPAKDAAPEKKAATETSKPAETSKPEEPKNAAAEFYKGKTVEFIVPRSPGGGYDTYARLMVPYLTKYLGVKSVVVKNIDGAGGLLGTNAMFKAPPDGLTLGIHGGINTVSNVLANLKGVEYQMDKFGWIGRVSTDYRALTVSAKGPYKTIDDMIKSKKPVKFGATGVGGGSYLDIVISNKALGINDEVVSGYEGSGEIDIGIIRGDVAGTWGSLASRMKLAKQGDAIILLQSGAQRSKELPDVPTWLETVKTPEGKKLLETYEGLVSTGRPISTSAGVPQERIDFLREAFDKVMKDPGYAEDCKKNELPLDYMSGKDIEKMMVDLSKMPDEVKKDIVAAMEGKLK